MNFLETDAFATLPSTVTHRVFQFSCEVVPESEERVEDLGLAVVNTVVDWTVSRSLRLPEAARAWMTARGELRGENTQIAWVADDTHWALRMRVLDSRAPRVWNTDIGLLARPDHLCFALRLVAHDLEADLRPPFTSQPVIVKDLVQQFRLVSGFVLDGSVFELRSEEDVRRCRDLAVDPRRQLCILIFGEHPDPRQPYALSEEDLRNAAAKLSGLAYVFCLPVDLEAAWKDVFGWRWTVEPGGVRTLHPGWRPSVRWEDHPSMGAEGAREQFPEPEQLTRFLHQKAFKALMDVEPDWLGCRFVDELTTAVHR